MFGKKFLALE